MARILLLNPNTGEATTKTMVRIARETVPRHEFIGISAPFGAPMIVEPQALATGGEAVLAMLAAQTGAGEAFDGFIVSAFGDPGLDTARLRFALPACGIGEASFHEAAEGGRRFAIATTTPLLDTAIAARVAASGHEAQFIGNFFTPGDAYAAVADPAVLETLLEGAVGQAIAAGAQAVIIGGGPLAQAAVALRHRFDVPIIEPIPAAARLMDRLLAHA